MNVYKVTFTYAAPNGMLRNANLIIEAADENAARIKALQGINSNCKYPAITRVALYAHQGDLDLSTEPPAKRK